MAKGKGSLDRVRDAAAGLGLEIEILEMPTSTRTAQDAATACGCKAGQIVKSLVFEGENSRQLFLFLVSGDNQLDVARATEMLGERPVRADPKKVRSETGFAIGGVSPIGHLTQLPTWIDESLMQYPEVWAAAGAPNAIFKVNPEELKVACAAEVATFA